MPYHALVVVMSGPASCARDEYNKMSSLGRQLMCLDAAFFKISQIGYLETKLGQSRIWLHLDGSWVAVGVKYAHQAFNNALTPYMVGWLAGTFPSRDMLCAIQKLWSSSGNSAGGGLASTRNAVENWCTSTTPWAWKNWNIAKPLTPRKFHLDSPTSFHMTDLLCNYSAQRVLTHFYLT